jgi:predicted dehydrogenase/threonine dehydrogenase-like Zn-dependent dehydrogenase
MKQVLQHQKTGQLVVSDVPAPQIKRGAVLVRTRASLISAGTERTSVATAQASMLDKARTRPDLVKQVIETAKREGLLATYRKVQARLDQTKALGYSCAGEVIASECEEFRPGDRVACAGAGYASHAELVVVPRNLCVQLPPEVSFEAAAFTTLGAIAMQGVRQADIRVGECVAVIGLGLLGQLTVQILRAAGCRVVGIDLDPKKLDLARELGASAGSLPERSAAVGTMLRHSGGRGADAVILTAGTQSNEPIELAGHLARDRARVVIVGAVGADIPRSPYFEKELQVLLSRSYGPGRYDPAYEEEGHDYPIGYVRWTEQRNMQSFVQMIADGQMDVAKLTTHRFDVADAAQAYDVILGKTNEPSIGVVLEYPDEPTSAAPRVPHAAPAVAVKGELGVGFIGAGGFASAHLLPPLQKAGVRFGTVVNSTGASASNAAKRFGFATGDTSAAAVLDDPSTQLVFIATRHDSHASLVAQALERGKAVFVEKPLAVSEQQLAEVMKAAERRPDHRIMVGFNRRFSDAVIATRDHMCGAGPLSMSYRVNAGMLPPSHWVHNAEQGGRIIGEACHFVDVLQFVSGARPVRVQAEALGGQAVALGMRNNVTFTISFDDGSIGTVHYFVGGAGAVGKEYLEVHGGGKSAIMDNFKDVTLASGGKSTTKSFNGDKGHSAEVLATVQAVREGKPMPISFQSLVDTTAVTLAVHEALSWQTPTDPRGLPG